MKNKYFIKRFLIFSMMMCMLMGSNVCLANNVDVAWVFYCQSEGTYTDVRAKDNTSKVYCYPTAGHSVYATAYGSPSQTRNGVICSGTPKIPVGIHGYITNYIKENGYSYGYLHIQRTAIDNTKCTGWWSIDSSGYDSTNPNHVIY